MRTVRNGARQRTGRGAVVAIALAVVATACAADPTTEAADATEAGSPPSVFDLTPTDPPAPSPVASPSPAPSPSPTVADLPGEPIEFFFADGDTLGVVGVPADDVLNVREAPGVDRRVVARLDPLTDDVTATGDARSLDRAIWVQVEAGGATGWANARFLAYPGRTEDATAEIVDAIGERPTAETVAALGRVVAESQASTEPRSEIRLVQRPSRADVPDVVHDVIGLGDDSVLGVRVRTFAEPTGAGDGFALRTVERTLLCDRGVTEDGLCL